MQNVDNRHTPALEGMPAPERAVLRMVGAAAENVLQDVVTNDVAALGPGRAVYAALLTPQGKYIADMLVLADPTGAGLLIDVPAADAQALAKRLSLYCLRRDARVLPTADLSVALAWAEAEEPVEPPAPPPDGVIVVDPRAPALGLRIYAPDAVAALGHLGARPASPERYTARRVSLEVPEHGVELLPNESFILEAGFDRLNGVDFRKGCYVGQEVTARMRHKTELKKRLVTVRVAGEAPPGTPVLTAEGKPAGTLFSQSGGRALAHLRLDRAKGTLSAGAAEVNLA